MNGFLIGGCIVVGIITIYVALGLFAKRKSAEKQSAALTEWLKSGLKHRDIMRGISFAIIPIACFLVFLFFIAPGLFPEFSEWFRNESGIFWSVVACILMGITLLFIPRTATRIFGIFLFGIAIYAIAGEAGTYLQARVDLPDPSRVEVENQGDQNLVKLPSNGYVYVGIPLGHCIRYLNRVGLVVQTGAGAVVKTTETPPEGFQVVFRNDSDGAISTKYYVAPMEHKDCQEEEGKAVYHR